MPPSPTFTHWYKFNTFKRPHPRTNDLTPSFVILWHPSQFKYSKRRQPTVPPTIAQFTTPPARPFRKRDELAHTPPPPPKYDIPTSSTLATCETSNDVKYRHHSPPPVPTAPTNHPIPSDVTPTQPDKHNFLNVPPQKRDTARSDAERRVRETTATRQIEFDQRVNAGEEGGEGGIRHAASASVG
mmetsp:Transcript_43294/g.52501  ORF Transcript_43294/g.52501 Transcript_43294/m.52501 type:complete len:185 (+) Transcript_43294:702-1256(+)